MLISDHLLALFFTVSPMQQSDLVWKLFQEKKICGIAQHIPNFCCSQASWLLPYSVWVKGRQGEKGSLWVSSPLCTLEPRPCTTRACDIPLQGPLRPSMDRLPGSGEKLEDPRKRREFCRFIPSLGKGRHWLSRLGEKEEGWGAGRKGIKQPGAKVHYRAGGGLEVTFQGGAS